MTAYSGVIRTLWLVLFVYRIIAAIGAKRNVGTRRAWKESGFRVGIIMFVLYVMGKMPIVRQTLQSAQAYVVARPIVGAAGLLLCVLGIGFAIWARVHLGRNWGMPMSAKESPELITTGPYRLVRHPIYTGILVAMLGSVLGESVFWTLPLVLFGAFFVYSARREEALMIRQFPDQYPAYMQRSNMLVPCIFPWSNRGSTRQ